MIRGRFDIDPRKFIRKLLDLMNQDRQALRANIFFLAFKCDRDQRYHVLSAVAVDTGFLVHGLSKLLYVAASAFSEAASI
jgi:hypothetical protein